MNYLDTTFRKEVIKKLAEIIMAQKLSTKDLSVLGIPVSILSGKVHRHSLFDLMYYVTLLGYDVDINIYPSSTPPAVIGIK